MVDPSQFDTMINWAFAIATLIYTTIGVVGYLMFGNAVCQEVRVSHITSSPTGMLTTSRITVQSGSHAHAGL